MLEIDRAFAKVSLSPNVSQRGFQFLTQVHLCLGKLLHNPSCRIPIDLPDTYDVIEVFRCTKVITDMARRRIHSETRVNEEGYTEKWVLESIWYLVLAIAREVPAHLLCFDKDSNPYGPLKRFFEGFECMDMPERWRTFPYLKEVAQQLFEGDNPPFLEYNDSIEEIPIAYSGTLYGNGPFHPNFPSEDPKIDQAALKKKNLCSFLVYLTQDGICDFSEILVLTLQNGLEIKRTPKEVRLFKTELLLAKQTMDIATESIWKLCKNGTTLPKNCAGGELWRHFNNGKSRYCKERWKFWRRMFIKLSDETGLGKDLPENTRHSLKSVVDKMTDTRDDWTGWKPEHMGTKSGISDPYNPFSARSTSPEPVLQEDYGHQAPRRAITDEDRFGSARIEERRSKDFVERDAKGNMIERPEDDIPSPASKAPDSRKRKRPKIHEAPQLEAPVLSQNNSIMASKVSDPRKEERPELHYTPQKPGAPVPCQSNPLTAVPEETGPPQSKRPRPNPTRPQPRMPQRAPRAKSVRKILPPLDSPVEAIIESRSYFGYVQYQVKFIGIPMGPEWYDSIGFKNDRDRAKIQDFHRNNPWAFNEEQSVALFAAKDAKQDAKQLAKWEAKMGNKKVKGGAGCGFEENGLEETEAEHLDAMAFDEDVRGDRMAEDSQSAASLLTAPQSKAADHLLLDPQLAALQPPLLPPIARLEAPAKPAEPPKPEIANLTPLSESGEAPEGTENYLPAALSPDYAEYPDPEAT